MSDLQYTELQNKMRIAVKDGNAQVLTPEIAATLKGMRIQTIYFGYRGQDGVEKNWRSGETKVRELLTVEGNETYIRHHFTLGNDFFLCSDADRLVYYVVLDKPTEKTNAQECDATNAK